MCGRFTLRVTAGAVAEQFAVVVDLALEPRFNIAPSQPLVAVRMNPSGDRREVALLRWGLIPPWAQDPTIGNRLINARAETVAEKPAFRAAFRRRRCLVVADGFYEWQRSGKRRQPYFIGLGDGRPFGFAGLWESWEGADHSVIESCTLLTTEANALVQPIHDRMPVILPPDSYATWLDPQTERGEGLLSLLQPYPPEAMRAYAVSPYVNSPTHEDPHCLDPVEPNSLFPDSSKGS